MYFIYEHADAERVSAVFPPQLLCSTRLACTRAKRNRFQYRPFSYKQVAMHEPCTRRQGRGEKKQCEALLLHMFSRNDGALREARDTTVTDYPTTKQRYTRESSSMPRALFNVIPRIGGYPLRAAASLMIKLRVSSLTRPHIHAQPTHTARKFFFSSSLSIIAARQASLLECPKRLICRACMPAMRREAYIISPSGPSFTTLGYNAAQMHFVV